MPPFLEQGVSMQSTTCTEHVSCSITAQVPPATLPLVGDAEIAQLKADVLSTGLPIAALVSTAWASASTCVLKPFFS